MNTYLITVDIRKRGRRRLLTRFLDTNMRNLCPINHCSYICQHPSWSTQEMREAISSILKREDRLFVMEAGAEVAWFGRMRKRRAEWLRWVFRRKARFDIVRSL